MAGEKGKNMTLAQLQDVIRYVMAEHTFGVKGHGIKYVRPHFDTRTGDIFGVSFDGMFGHKDLFVVNEDRDRNLTVWVMDFLDSDPAKAGYTVSETPAA